MNEFDIYLESTGSMEVYPGNRMAVFRNLLPEPLQLDGDWRVALAEIVFPSSIKNVTSTSYMIYTPKTPYDSSSHVKPSSGTIVRREDWSDNATFPAGEYKSVLDILNILKEGTSSKKPLAEAKLQDNVVELKFNKGYGISFHDRSILNVLGFTGAFDTNRGGFFIGSNKLVQEQPQPIRGEFPSDIITGTEIFFVYCNIIEQQNVAGTKAPVLRVIDTKRRLKNGELSITSTTTDRSFRELQFKSLVLSSIREIFIELVTATGAYVPFLGTGRVVLTLKFRKFD